MPYRKTPLVNDETYHVFNRSIAKIPIFNTQNSSNRFLEILEYYRFSQPQTRLSYFLRLSETRKKQIIDTLLCQNDVDTEILAFCIMPNHFHLLLRQTKEGGISKFIGLIQNSYAKYLNLVSNRTGSVFQQTFKAIRIESESQLVHTARYIHLNPVTDFVLKKPEELNNYPLTSFPDYISDKPRTFISTQYLLPLFSSKEKFVKHTFDQADCQRTLSLIKHHAE